MRQKPKLFPGTDPFLDHKPHNGGTDGLCTFLKKWKTKEAEWLYKGTN